MNPTNIYNPSYLQQFQQPQAVPMQHLPRQPEPQIVPYNIETAEQLATINPMPNTIYLGINHRAGKIFMRYMNNDGLLENKTFTLVTEQTKKTDIQEIIDRLTIIEKKIGDTNEPTTVA